MNLFLIATFPLFTVLTLRRVTRQTPCSYFSVMFFGLFAGVCVCLFQTFFVFSPKYVPASFLYNFFKTLVINILLPFMVLGGAAWFFPPKGALTDIAARLDSFFPMLTAFFAVIVPYRVLNAAFPPAYYELLVIPLMYAVLLLDTALCLKRFCAAVAKNAPLAIIASLIFLIGFVCMASASESLRSIDAHFSRYSIATVFFFVLSFVYIFLNRRSA